MPSSFEERYIWPITDSTYGSEVYANTSQDNTQPGFTFSDRHPFFSGSKSLTLNGLYVDIDVGPTSLSGQDFSLTIHFKQTASAPTATVFSYKSNIEAPSMINEFKMTIENDQLAVSKYAYNITEKKVFTNKIYLNTWHTFIFCVTRSEGRYEIYLDDEGIEYVDKYTLNQSLETPGKIRLGAELDGGNLFTGSIICMGLFAKTIQYEDMDEVRMFCDSSQWLYQPSGKSFLFYIFHVQLL